VDVENFIELNITPYTGNEEFLAQISDKTEGLWDKCINLLNEELKVGVLDIDMDHVAGINSFNPGYINKEDEVIVGLQSDAPLKRVINPYGGIRLVKNILEIYGREMPEMLNLAFGKWHKTHNQGVFDAYTHDMRTARSIGLLTGLLDAYRRGRMVKRLVQRPMVVKKVNHSLQVLIRCMVVIFPVHWHPSTLWPNCPMKMPVWTAFQILFPSFQTH